MGLLCLWFLVVTPCLFAEAFQMCPLRNNDAQYRSMYFNKCSDHVLLGRGYRDFKGTRLKCATDCLADTSCFSFQYTDADGRCVLNGASALRFPLSLTKANGTLYYGPEKASFVSKLWQSASEYPGLPGRTDCTYSSPTSAASECQRVGQHLCEPPELQQAFEAGYYHDVSATDSGSWYALPLRSVAVRSSGLTYEDLPDPVITTDGYTHTDPDAVSNACCELEAHPCTLAELKEAYLRGYRQPSSEWLLFALPGRDVQLYSDGCGDYIGGAECYEEVVANTPRPNSNVRVICCPLCSGLPGLCCPED